MSGGKGSKTTTTRVEIPDFLKPFVKQGADVASGALSSLQDMLPPGTSLVAGFDPAQTRALSDAEAIAGGAGGFLPTAQDTLLKTARGDNLYGGAGFNAAVDAAVREAQPNILSAFGRAGRGVSGLGQAAIQSAASDAFARLYDSERARQEAAARALPDVALAGSRILSDVGGQRQGQAQRELEGPVAAAERLFSRGLGVTPSQAALFGQSTTQPASGSKAGSALGAATSLAGLMGGGKGGV